MAQANQATCGERTMTRMVGARLVRTARTNDDATMMLTWHPHRPSARPGGTLRLAFPPRGLGMSAGREGKFSLAC